MIRRPPRSTRTDTLFPYTTLFRSVLATILVGDDPASATYVKMKANACGRVGMQSRAVELSGTTATSQLLDAIRALNVDPDVHGILLQHRSEERRVGKECVSTCRSRWSQYH